MTSFLTQLVLKLFPCRNSANIVMAKKGKKELNLWRSNMINFRQKYFYKSLTAHKFILLTMIITVVLFSKFLLLLDLFNFYFLIFLSNHHCQSSLSLSRSSFPSFPLPQKFLQICLETNKIQTIAMNNLSQSSQNIYCYYYSFHSLFHAIIKSS